MRKYYIISICLSFTLCSLAQNDLKKLEQTVDAKTQNTIYINEHRGHDLLDPDGDMFGIGYRYSKDFPLGFALEATMIKYLYGAFNFGLNFNDNEYNFDNIIYNPKGFITIEPGLRTKYFGASVGIGVVFGEKKEFLNSEGVSFSSETFSYSSSYSYISKCGAGYFMLQPAVKGILPIDDESFYLYAHIGYNIVPKISDLNGLVFGIGVMINTEW